MAEMFDFDGNLFSITEIGDDVRDLTYEEIMAERQGGDPVEWIPEAERERELVDQALFQGKPLVAMNPEPDVEGVFEGMHEIRLLDIKSQLQMGQIVVRHLFASIEQYESKRFTIPITGYFVE